MAGIDKREAAYTQARSELLHEMLSAGLFDRDENKRRRFLYPHAVAVPVGFRHSSQLMFGQAVQVQPHGPEPFRLDQVIGGEESLLKVAAAFHPQKIFKLDAGCDSRARIEAVCRIDHRTNLAGTRQLDDSHRSPERQCIEQAADSSAAGASSARARHFAARPLASP